MSSVVKAIAAPFKAIGKISKNILSGAKKAFKSLTSSTFGRALLIGATIYLGGAALGYWNSPFTSINGAFASPAAAGSGTVSAAADAAAVTAEASPAAMEAAAGAGATDSTAAALSNSAAGTGSLGAIPPAGNLAEAATTYGGTGSAVAGADKGLIYGSMKSGGSAAPGFFSSDLAKYGAIQAGAGALQGAFSPDAIDVANEQARLERENLQWRNEFLDQNFQVGSLNLGMSPSGQPLRDTSGNLIYPTPPIPGQPGKPVVPTPPRGLINTAMVR